MDTLVAKYRLTFRSMDDSAWLHGLLTDQGMYGKKPLLLDWSYDHCGGEFIEPSKIDENTLQVEVWLVYLPDVTDEQVKTLLNSGQGIVSVELVESSVVELAEPYSEGDFLGHLPPSDDIPSWVERHSVNCIKCGVGR